MQYWRGVIVLALALMASTAAPAVAQNGTTTGAETPSADAVGQLERLATLRAEGVLTEEEFAAAKARLLAAIGASASANPLDSEEAKALCERLVAGLFDATLPPPALLPPSKQASAAIDGSDREVAVLCSWQTPGPTASTLQVSIVCPDASNVAMLCTRGGSMVGMGEPACSWPSSGGGEAVTQSGCLLRGAMTQRADVPPPELDVHQAVRAMAARMGPRQITAPTPVPPAPPTRAPARSSDVVTAQRGPSQSARGGTEICPLQLDVDLTKAHDFQGRTFRSMPEGSQIVTKTGSYVCDKARVESVTVTKETDRPREVLLDISVLLSTKWMRQDVNLTVSLLVNGETVKSEEFRSLTIGDPSANWAARNVAFAGSSSKARGLRLWVKRAKFDEWFGSGSAPAVRVVMEVADHDDEEADEE